MSVHSNYQAICHDIALAAQKSGRNPADVSLVAVTKHMEWKIVKNLYDHGQRDFGENRVMDALQKQQIAPGDCHWHFIGHLQSNKLRKILGKFALIHSIDSWDLAEKLSQLSVEAGLITSVLLQANTSGEPSKQGATPAEWKRHFEKIHCLKGLSIKGLMTMAPMAGDEKMIRQCFAGLRHLRDELNKQVDDQAKLHHLSMGMSGDFKIAIEEGATLVRIGTALFSS